MVLRCLRTTIFLKSVIQNVCPFTGQTDFIVPVRDCSIGSKLLRISNDFLFYISEFLSVLYDIT